MVSQSRPQSRLAVAIEVAVVGRVPMAPLVDVSSASVTRRSQRTLKSMLYKLITCKMRDARCEMRPALNVPIGDGGLHNIHKGIEGNECGNSIACEVGVVGPSITE